METASPGSCFVSLLESGFPISCFFLTFYGVGRERSLLFWIPLSLCFSLYPLERRLTGVPCGRAGKGGAGAG